MYVCRRDSKASKYPVPLVPAFRLPDGPSRAFSMRSVSLSMPVRLCRRSPSSHRLSAPSFAPGALAAPDSLADDGSRVSGSRECAGVFVLGVKRKVEYAIGAQPGPQPCRAGVGMDGGTKVTTLLVVEDETTVRETLARSFEAEGFDVLSAADGLEGLRLARENQPDLVVLDLMLPEMDGLSVCRVLRKESDVPIIMLTARGMEMDKIVGLETGADDYVVKPFSFGELLARVRANLLRVDGESRRTRTRLQSGDLQLDLVSRRAHRGDVELRLTHKEFDLLAELMRNKGAALSRDLLLTQVWGYDYVGDSHTVDVHIRWLREKIEDDPARPKRITTVRGVGYRFEA